ncbi:DUF401 family protein [Desulfitobacterium chlororespirans]|uniref:DUF401 family protein n=1 Tax=Desulfitobacterium chlororespirans DSM 11544 TaxID=1121395 RepID=A0A1M7UWK2_9FIRM|nr:DUF401 family protein [Desulfitobacterium chlororespirans]SHN87297.1 hypothetical protein SAMN02745215_04843 [Desulfitobacterium chlororespirans DSM 11544]
MFVIVKIGATLAMVVWLLRKKIQIGHAMLAGSIVLFLISSPTLGKADAAVQTTLREVGTWEVVFAMYFVMCLEQLLRTTGIIEGFMAAMKPLLRSDRVLLAFMPTFLGLLPSLGGAIFSAPMVEQASKKFSLSPEKKGAINYWFRHVWEYGNPIIPGVLLASQITGIPLGTFVANMIGYTLLALLLGVVFILTGKGFESGPAVQNDLVKDSDAGKNQADSLKTRSPFHYFLLGVGPILVNIILVVAFDLSAALSMGIVVLGMVIILRFTRQQLATMLREAFEKKILWGILGILFFQHVLTVSGIVQELIAFFQGTNIPVVVMLGLGSLIVALLTGSPQGAVAVIFPILSAFYPGNLETATVAYIMAIAGAMLSPAHLCLIVTAEYFKADLFKILKPVLLLEVIILTFMAAVHLI